REAANRADCANNLKQLGLAWHGFHDTYRKFPNVSVNGGRSVFRVLLPYIEQGVMVRSSGGLVNNVNDLNAVANDIRYLNAPPIRTFICPSRRSTAKPWCDF